jgi:hypothetical protein
MQSLHGKSITDIPNAVVNIAMKDITEFNDDLLKEFEKN